MEEIALRAIQLLQLLLKRNIQVIKVGLGQKDINMHATIFHLENMPLIMLKTPEITIHSSQEANSNAVFII